VNKPLTLKGTLSKWEMINPHSWFHLDVKDPSGKVTEWMVEGGSPNTLIRLGVTKNTIKIGTELTIEGYQAKEGTNKAVGRNFVLPDGTRLFLSLGGSVPGHLVHLARRRKRSKSADWSIRVRRGSRCKLSRDPWTMNDGLRLSI
jgi:hypothetical protein